MITFVDHSDRNNTSTTCYIIHLPDAVPTHKSVNSVTADSFIVMSRDTWRLRHPDAISNQSTLLLVLDEKGYIQRVTLSCRARRMRLVVCCVTWRTSCLRPCGLAWAMMCYN